MGLMYFFLMEEITECLCADGNDIVEKEMILIPGKIMKGNKIQICKRNRIKKVCSTAVVASQKEVIHKTFTI